MPIHWPQKLRDGCRPHTWIQYLHSTCQHILAQVMTKSGLVWSWLLPPHHDQHSSIQSHDFLCSTLSLSRPAANLCVFWKCVMQCLKPSYNFLPFWVLLFTAAVFIFSYCESIFFTSCLLCTRVHKHMWERVWEKVNREHFNKTHLVYILTALIYASSHTSRV